MKLMTVFMTAVNSVIWLAQPLAAQTSRDTTEIIPTVVAQPKTAEVLQPLLHGSIGGCFAAACHGSASADGPAWSRSARDWLSRDPHAGAYTTLLSDNSREIVRKLSRGNVISGDSIAYDSILELKCTSCHANPLASREQRKLGVDCQSCHGPAAAWGDVHYSRDWKKQGPSRFTNTSFIDTESLIPRARLCTSCHVGELNSGGGPREVDHDLIAAGHPPLHFDFESYWSRLPAHWDTSEDARLHGNTVVYRRWQAGKLVHAMRRIKLLADRTERVEQSISLSSTWPELSEYSCYDCHHELRVPSWRQERSQGATAISNWDPWTMSELETSCIGPTSLDLRRCLTELRNEMQKRQPAHGDVRASAQAALRLLTNQLDLVATAEPPTQTQLRDKLKLLLQIGPTKMDWESANQWLSAADAMSHALGLDVGERESATLQTGVLRGSDELPNRYLSSPMHFDPQNFELSRQRLLKILEKEQQP